jgi:hypothetical protein
MWKAISKIEAMQRIKNRERERERRNHFLKPFDEHLSYK